MSLKEEYDNSLEAILKRINKGREELRKEHPIEEEIERDFQILHRRLIRKMLDTKRLVCPDCGGPDLVWACSNRKIGTQEED